jgi:hypothetical protein
MRLRDAPIAGTFQGIWPGIRVIDEHGAFARPSAAPWIDTNAGFLRYARSAGNATIWIGERPPEKTVIPLRRYLMAVADAAINGARWVIALEPQLHARLLARDPDALKDWKEIAAHLRFFEEHKEWRGMRPRGDVALIEDAASGALITGGLHDMIAVKHLPTRPVPAGSLKPSDLDGARIAVTTDAKPPAGQEQALALFAKSGGRVVGAPADYQPVSGKNGGFLIDAADAPAIDSIWKQINSYAGRENLGVRLFNVSSILSHLLETPGQKQVVLHLLNYSEYPVVNVSVELPDAYTRARLYAPGAEPIDIAVERARGGTNLLIERRVDTLATLVLE